MATSTIAISGSKTGLAGGSSLTIGPFSLTNNSAPDAITAQAFTAATFAAVTVPSGATGVAIVPPSSNTGTITLKGVTGDTGVTIHKTQPTFLSLDSGASFGLLCANAITVEFQWT